MSEESTEALSVVVGREIPHPPERIARSHAIAPKEWLMRNDFKPVVDHGFNLRVDWGRSWLSGPGSRCEQNARLSAQTGTREQAFRRQLQAIAESCRPSPPRQWRSPPDGGPLPCRKR